MRKPINNETKLINEIWNGKLLNEKQQSAAPSIYQPQMTNIMTDPASAAVNKYLPWADRLGKAARAYKTKKTPENSSQIAIPVDDEGEQTEIPSVKIEPFINRTIPAGGVHPGIMGDLETQKLAADNLARERQNAVSAGGKYNTDDGIPSFIPNYKRNLDDKITKGTISSDEVKEKLVGTSEQPMDVAVATKRMVDTVNNIFKSNKEYTPVGGYKPATELGGIEGFAPALSASEFDELGMGKPSVPNPRKTDFTPQDVGVPLKIPTGPAIPAGKADEIDKSIAVTTSKAEKLAAEKQKATPEQNKKIETSAEMLSKETGKTITPWSVAHSKAVDASIKSRSEQQKSQETPKTETKPVTKTPDGGAESGRDISNIVPGSQMWGELSSSERQKIRDRYAKGEGPSVSIRYNKETDRFDEPGYGDQGRYGDMVKALNMRESVNYYCNFITEMARRKSTKNSKEPIIPGIPATNKLKTDDSKPTEQPDLFSSVSTPAPASATPKPRRKSSRSKSEPKMEVKSEPVSVTAEPVITSEPTSKTTVAEVKPVDTTVTPPTTPTTSPVTPLIPDAEPPMMSRTKAAGLGAAAGAVGTGLLATILAITSKGSQPQTTTLQQSQMSQPAPVNTQNTPPFETPPETHQKPKSRIFRF